jgi:hypothetical protein
MHIAVIIHKQTASSLAFGIIGFVNGPTFVTRHGKLIGVQIFSPLRLFNFQLFALSQPRAPSRPLTRSATPVRSTPPTVVVP